MEMWILTKFQAVSAISPVPGGVGTVTSMILLPRNKAMKLQKSRKRTMDKDP